jgi:outer membrane protein assembly factor BamB
VSGYRTNDYPNAIAVDAAGNVYVTGASQSPMVWYAYDYVTLKYAPDGTQLWSRGYHGPGPQFSHNVAGALAIDPKGNVIVTGTSTRFGSTQDYATIKYDPDGTTLWVARTGSSGTLFNGGDAVTVDALGSVYVTGTYAGQLLSSARQKASF